MDSLDRRGATRSRRGEPAFLCLETARGVCAFGARFFGALEQFDKAFTFLQIALTVLALALLSGCGRRQETYEAAMALMDAGQYVEAAGLFDRLGDYQYAQVYAEAARQAVYDAGANLAEDGEFARAAEVFGSLAGYRDAAKRADSLRDEAAYAEADVFLTSGAYAQALHGFHALGAFSDARERAAEAWTLLANTLEPLLAAEQYEPAIEWLTVAADYPAARAALAVCEEDRRAKGLFTEAMAALAGRDLSQAAEMLNALPESYAEHRRPEAAVLSGALDGARLFDAGDFLAAASAFDPLRRADGLDTDYADAGFEALAAVYGLDGSVPRLPFAPETAKAAADGASDKLQALCEDFFRNSLYRYYMEQAARKGANLFTLADYPFQYADADGSNWAAWYDRRTATLEAGLAEAGLTEAYDRQTRDISPSTVTGQGLYINARQAPRNQTWLSAVRAAVPLVYLAGTPPEARYVLTFAETYALYGTYDDGTKAYTTHTRVTLKDMAEGALLFNQTYSAPPPANTELLGDVYGRLDFTEALAAEILPALAEALPCPVAVRAAS